MVAPGIASCLVGINSELQPAGGTVGMLSGRGSLVVWHFFGNNDGVKQCWATPWVKGVSIASCPMGLSCFTFRCGVKASVEDPCGDDYTSRMFFRRCRGRCKLFIFFDARSPSFLSWSVWLIVWHISKWDSCGDSWWSLLTCGEVGANGAGQWMIMMTLVGNLDGWVRVSWGDMFHGSSFTDMFVSVLMNFFHKLTTPSALY
jgi:hypothetical protein